MRRECDVPSVTFQLKWLATMLFPVVVLCMLYIALLLLAAVAACRGQVKVGAT